MSGEIPSAEMHLILHGAPDVVDRHGASWAESCV
jgi:hypothetical protein